MSPYLRKGRTSMPKPRKPKPPKSRNPMAAVARRMKAKVEPVVKAYRRKPKHKKKPGSDNGNGEAD